MTSAQTLSESDRRVVAAWAADCAERVLPLFEAEARGDGRARDAIARARARAFGRGEVTAATEIRRRFEAGRAALEVASPAAVAASKSAAQAAAVAHMGAHALGAVAYAARAAELAANSSAGAAQRELEWQLEHASPDVRAALARLPQLGHDPSGPLGPGLLARGDLAANIGWIQARL